MQMAIFAPGTRIELVTLLDDPDPIPPRTSGTVVVAERLGDAGWALEVDWDDGRARGLAIPPHRVRPLVPPKVVDTATLWALNEDAARSGFGRALPGKFFDLADP